MKKIIVIILCLAAIFFGWQYVMNMDRGDKDAEENTEIEKVEQDYSVYPDEISFKNRYYYTLLSDREKRAYENLAEGIRDSKDEIKIWVGGEEEVNRVVKSVYYDFPEYFWFECSASYETYDWLGYSRIKPNYIYSGDKKEELKGVVKDYVKKVYESADGSSDYKTIKSVYEYVILNTDYVSKAEDDQDILSVMKNGKSVCAGYSKSMGVLLRCLGFECIYVIGSDENSNSHAWNIVKVGDDYYHIDATWGDPVYTEGSTEYSDYVSYAYLLCSDDDMLGSHKESREFTYPACTSDEYSCYVMEGTYFKEFSDDAIYQKMKEAIDNKEKCLTFKFGSREVYEKALHELTENGLLKRGMHYQMIRSLRPSAHCNYSNNDDMRTLSIYFEYGL